MKVSGWIPVVCLLGVLFAAGTAFAGPDNYLGDSAIYGGSTIDVKPNVLIILFSAERAVVAAH